MRGAIGQKVRTARNLWRRWRSDGRLPPESRRLAIDSLLGTVADRVAAPVARVLPVVGRRLGPVGPVARNGWRRWSTAGSLAASVHDLQHDTAQRVVAALEAGGVHPFATDATGGRLEFGLTVAEADAAWRALTTLDPLGTWYVEWARGERRRSVLTTARWRRGPVRRSATWRIFQMWRDGDGHLVGPEAAVTIGFWAPGPLGRLERVGVRGLTRFPADSPPSAELVDGHTYPSRRSFAVGRAVGRHDQPIDLLFTWVDGDDPAWREERAKWSGDVVHTTEDAVDEARFRSRDELRYALRSVAQYAGWVRKVFVVTADQRPDWLVEDERLRVVPHSEIFPAEWLPTFNSHSIESRLHHIEGLADHFVYLNDDMFIGRPISPDLLFTPNGLPLFFMGEGRIGFAEVEGDLGVDAAARNGRRLIAETWGRTVERKLLHAPYAHRRDILDDAERIFAADFERTGRSRFRASTDLSVASSFAQYVGYCTGRALPGAVACKYVNIENLNVGKHLRQIGTRRFDTFCLNATEQPAGDVSGIDRMVTDFLEAYFPNRSPWESTGG